MCPPSQLASIGTGRSVLLAAVHGMSKSLTLDEVDFG